MPPRMPTSRCSCIRRSGRRSKRCRRFKIVYETIEQPLVPVLYRMERAGVLVDRELLKAQSSELAARMLELQAQAHAEAGGVFNVDSPKQLQEILFGKLGIPVMRKTPTGQPSTAEDVLEELAETYRAAEIDSWNIAASPSSNPPTPTSFRSRSMRRTGRIHTSYHQAVAATGRLSSTDPNLQNIPIRTHGGTAHPAGIHRAARPLAWSPRIIRKSNCASWRICPAMRACCGAFAEDRDVHQATAAEVFGTPLEQVSADQRRSAKAINFGLMYGMSAFGLARQLGIGRGEAQKYMDLYFERYPGVRRYMEETRRQARETGYRGDGVRPAAVSAGNPVAQRGAAPVCRAQRHQCAHAGHRRRHHQARHDRGGRLAAELRACRRGSSCRCTTNWCSRWRTRRSRPL